MKSLDEVIKKIEKQWICPSSDEADEYCELYDVRDDALHYLKEHRELTKELVELNQPLTWNELKDMIGKPIWVERTEEYCVPHWAIVENIIEWDSIDNSTLLLQPDDEELFLSDHAKTWRAYRKEQK